jgi:hypothetical protein
LHPRFHAAIFACAAALAPLTANAADTPNGTHRGNIVTQHATAWIIREWNDPRRHRNERAECDDINHPYASHPECDRISGKYREGDWFVYISAQTLNPHQRVRVIVGAPIYKPHEEMDENNKSKVIERIIKIPLLFFGRTGG